MMTKTVKNDDIVKKKLEREGGGGGGGGEREREREENEKDVYLEKSVTETVHHLMIIDIPKRRECHLLILVCR